MGHWCAEWDERVEGLVHSFLGIEEEDEEAWFRDFEDEEDQKMRVISYIMELRTSGKCRVSDSPLVRLRKLSSCPPALVRIPVPPITKRYMSFAAPAARPGLVLPPTQSLVDSSQRVINVAI